MNFNKTQKQNINNLNAANTTQTPIGAPNWNALGRVNVIKRWAEEIKAATSNSSSLQDWKVIGTAVTIIHNDVNDCQQIIARVAQDISFEFLHIASKDVETFLTATDEMTDKPHATLIYLEPGDWMKDQEDSSNSNIHTSLQSKIKNFNTDAPVIFVTSTAIYTDISSDLRKAGMFDRRFIVLKPTLEESAVGFIQMIGEDICSDAFKDSLGKIGKLLDLEFDDKRRQELIALTLKRIAKREARKIEFGDLVYLSTRGSAESDEYPKLSIEFDKKIAVHEAGHALVAMIDSQGQNVPEYVSILEAENFCGIVTDSMGYHFNKHKSKTYSDIRHHIRICLAGRVAEHIVYGPENVSVSSASDDLRKATELCFYLFSSRGISPEMDAFQGACSNLTVELEDDKPFDKKRTELLAREYLAKQYQIVFDMINENKSLYEKLVEELMKKSVLDQSDLLKIVNPFQVN